MKQRFSTFDLTKLIQDSIRESDEVKNGVKKITQAQKEDKFDDSAFKQIITQSEQVCQPEEQQEIGQEQEQVQEPEMEQPHVRDVPWDTDDEQFKQLLGDFDKNRDYGKQVDDSEIKINEPKRRLRNTNNTIQSIVNSTVEQQQAERNPPSRTIIQTGSSTPDLSWGQNRQHIINRDTGCSIQFEYVYKKIAQLIDNGNQALQILQAIDPQSLQTGVLTATSSLINSIRGCITQFTKIHELYIKFQQALAIQEKRYQYKIQLMKMKNSMKAKKQADFETTGTVEMVGTDLLDFVQWQKQKKAIEQTKIK